jgi:hypothetical protein
VDRPGHEHLARTGLRADPRRYVDGDPGDIVVDQLALAGVEPGTNPEVKLVGAGADPLRATDRAGRTVEHA